MDKTYKLLFASDMTHLSKDSFVSAFGLEPRRVAPYDIAFKHKIFIREDSVFAVGYIYDGELVAALYVPETPAHSFEFDIVVSDAHQRKGLGGALVDFAVQIYDEYLAEYGFTRESYPYRVAVVDVRMKRILESKGFYVSKEIRQTDSTYWLMTI